MENRENPETCTLNESEMRGNVVDFLKKSNPNVDDALVREKNCNEGSSSSDSCTRCMHSTSRGHFCSRLLLAALKTIMESSGPSKTYEESYDSSDTNGESDGLLVTSYEGSSESCKSYTYYYNNYGATKLDKNDHDTSENDTDLDESFKTIKTDHGTILNNAGLNENSKTDYTEASKDIEKDLIKTDHGTTLNNTGLGEKLETKRMETYQWPTDNLFKADHGTSVIAASVEDQFERERIEKYKQRGGIYRIRKYRRHFTRKRDPFV